MNSKKWLSVWGNAPSFAESKVESYAKDVTLRYVIKSAFDADKIRLHFSNLYNNGAATVNRVSVALTGNDPAKIETSTLKTVTFNQKEALTMDKDCDVISDEVDFEIKKDQLFSVSFYIKDLTPVSCGTATSGDLSLRFFTQGDRTYDADFPTESKHVDPCYRFLSIRS